MGLRWGLLALMVTSGCATSRALCPLEGGLPWREVRSTHFRVHTNLEERAALKTAVQLEQFRRAMSLTWGPDFDPPGTVEVILLRNPRDMEEFTDRHYAGFTRQTPDGPRMAMTGGGGYLAPDAPGDANTLTHELAHHLSAFALPRQPRWLSEGLASYLQNISFKDDGRVVELRGFNPMRFDYIRRHGWLDLDALWQWDGKTQQSSSELQQHYASAWLWVHYLSKDHPDRFRDFQTRMTRGEEPRRAFEDAFRGAGAFEANLVGFVRSWRIHDHARHPMPPVRTQTQTLPLSPSDVHVIRALLFLQAPGDGPVEERVREAERELDQSLKEDPLHVETLRLRAASMDDAERLKLARTLVERHPEDGRAWDLLANSLDAEGDVSAAQEDARERAATLLPDSPGAQNDLAWYYVRTLRPQKGILAAERAVRLMPGNAAILSTHAALDFLLGRCEEAVAMGRRARDMLHEGVSDATRQEFQRVITVYETQCPPATPGAP
jgi:hypothetical protein